MFDKLEDLLIRFEEIMGELQEPDVVNDQARFRSIKNTRHAMRPSTTVCPCWKMKAMRKCGSF